MTRTRTHTQTQPTQNVYNKRRRLCSGCRRRPTRYRRCRRCRRGAVAIIVVVVVVLARRCSRRRHATTHMALLRHGQRAHEAPFASREHRCAHTRLKPATPTRACECECVCVSVCVSECAEDCHASAKLGKHSLSAMRRHQTYCEYNDNSSDMIVKVLRACKMHTRYA